MSKRGQKTSKLSTGLRTSGALGLISIALLLLTTVIKIGIEGARNIDTGLWTNIPLVLEFSTLIGASFYSNKRTRRNK